jgi:hypothetical protein
MPAEKRKPMETAECKPVHGHDGSPERDVRARLRTIIFNALRASVVNDAYAVADIVTSAIERDPLLKVELREHVPTMEEGIAAIIEREFGQFGNADAQAKNAARKILQTIELSKMSTGEPADRHPYIKPYE